MNLGLLYSDDWVGIGATVRQGMLARNRRAAATKQRWQFGAQQRYFAATQIINCMAVSMSSVVG